MLKSKAAISLLKQNPTLISLDCQSINKENASNNISVIQSKKGD